MSHPVLQHCILIVSGGISDACEILVQDVVEHYVHSETRYQEGGPEGEIPTSPPTPPSLCRHVSA